MRSRFHQLLTCLLELRAPGPLLAASIYLFPSSKEEEGEGSELSDSGDALINFVQKCKCKSAIVIFSFNTANV